MAPAARRALSATMAALYLSSLSLSGLHLAVVEHAICEHGDVVHGALHGALHGDLHAHAQGSAGAGRTVQRAPVPVGAIQATAEDHAHCDLDQRNDRFTLALVPPLEEPVEMALLVDVEAMPAGQHPSARALYRLAPKQSPPV